MAMKYYHTTKVFYKSHLDKIKEKFNYSGSNQFNIVCKANSLSEANRVAEELKLGKNVFARQYTSTSSNSSVKEIADKHGFLICIERQYVDIKEIL